MGTEETLTKKHLQDLYSSGLSDETIVLSGCYSATEEEVAAILGFDPKSSGLVLPYPDLDGGASIFRRVKLDNPFTPRGKKKLAKYLSPKNSQNHLYVPPNLDREALRDASTTIIITEGEKKALKACQEGLACIALPGVWGFKTFYVFEEDGIKTYGRLLPELEHYIVWKGRKTLIAYDSDIIGNESVMKAEEEFAKILTLRRAQVYGLRIPNEDEYRPNEKGEYLPPETKVGLDDYLLCHAMEYVYSLPRVSYTGRPMARDDAGALVFPTAIMTGAAGTYAKTMTEHLESPASFFFISYLVCLGNLLCDSITVDSELRPQPRLYVILLGESADDRKSTAATRTINFFKSTLTLGDFGVNYGLGSAEGLARVLKDNPRLLIYFDELKSFCQKARVKASNLLPVVGGLFELNRFQNVVKNKSIDIDNVYISLLGCSTSETYSTMFDPEFLNIGFINRLFIVLDHGERRFSMPMSLPMSVKDELILELKNTSSFAHSLSNGGMYVMPVDSNARDLFQEWYLRLEQSVFSRRLDTFGHRFMPLLAINDKKKVIDLETVQKTISLLEYELETRKQVDPVDADNKLAALEERMRRTVIQEGRMKERNLQIKLHKNRYGNWMWNTALGNLIKAGEFGRSRSEVWYRELPA